MQRAAAGLAAAVLDLLGRRLRPPGAAAGRLRATTAATRCTPARCWPAAGRGSRRCCSPTRAHEAGLAALRARRRPGRRRVADGRSRPDVVVDGIVGIGGRPGLRPEAAAALARVRRASRSSPSTCRAGSTSTPASSTAPHVRADVTVTFGTHKVAPPRRPGRGGVRRRPPRRHRARPPGGRRVEALQADDVARAAAAARRRTPTSTPAAWSASAPARQRYPGAGVLVVAGAACGLAGMVRYVGGARRRRSAPRTPRSSSATGRVQAWVVGSGGGADGGRGARRGAWPTACRVVVDADALAPRRRPARPRRRVLTPHAGELAAMLGVERADVEAAPLAHARAGGRASYDAVGAAQGPPHARRRARTAGSGSTTTGVPWLATAGAGDVLAGLSARCSPAGLDAVRRRRRSAPGCTAPRPPWPSAGGPLVAGDVAAALPVAVPAVTCAVTLPPDGVMEESTA